MRKKPSYHHALTAALPPHTSTSPAMQRQLFPSLSFICAKSSGIYFHIYKW